MLEFNPFFRPTAHEILKNKIFDSIRVPELEKGAPITYNIEVDRNEFEYDYENECMKNT